MIEKGLNQHCFLPGTERYTRPEEVKALSKFLKHVKEVQEEHTNLVEDNLMLPGSKDIRPKLPGVSGLENRRLDINGNEDRVDLEHYRDDLKRKETPDLETSRLGTPKNEGGTKESLETGRETLEGAEDIPLSTGRENLKVNQDVSLEGTKETLTGTEEVNSLSQDLETLEAAGDIDLETNLETIKPGDTPNLSQSLERITPGSTPDLGRYQEELQKGDDPSLETGRESLSGTLGETPLETDLEKLTGTLGDTPLSETREELQDSRSIALEDTKETLKDVPQNFILSQTSESLNLPKEDPTLETDLENLYGTSDVDLSQEQETLKRPEDVELESGRESLKKGEEVSLEEDLETLSLPTDSLELSAGMEVLEDGREIELEGEVEKLEVTGDITLEDYREGLEDNRDNSLSDYRESLEGPEDKELEDYREDIQKPDDIPLEDTRLETPENQGGSKEELEDTILETPENQGGSREELEDTLIDTPENQGGSKEELEDTIIETPDNQGGSKEELEDTRIDLEGPEDVELDDTRIDLEKNDDIPLSDYREFLEGPEDIPLDDTRIDLEGPEDVELDDTRIDLEKNDDIPLDDTRIDLEGPGDVELDDTRLDLEDDREPSLEDYLGTLEEGNWTEISELPDTLEELLENDLSRVYKDPGETYEGAEYEGLGEGEWKEISELPDYKEDLTENDLSREVKDYESVFKDPETEILKEGDWPEISDLPNEVDREPGIENITFGRDYKDPDRRREEDYPDIYAVPQNAELLGDEESGFRARTFEDLSTWEVKPGALEDYQYEKLRSEDPDDNREIPIDQNTSNHWIHDFYEINSHDEALLKRTAGEFLAFQETESKEELPENAEFAGILKRDLPDVPSDTYENLEDFQKGRMGGKQDPITGGIVPDSESWLLKNKTEVGQGRNSRDRGYTDPESFETSKELEEHQKEKMKGKKDATGRSYLPDSESYILHNRNESPLEDFTPGTSDLEDYQKKGMGRKTGLDGKEIIDSESWLLSNKTSERSYTDPDQRKDEDYLWIHATPQNAELLGDEERGFRKRDFQDTSEFTPGTSDLEDYQKKKVTERKKDSAGKEIINSEATLPINETTGRTYKNLEDFKNLDNYQEKKTQGNLPHNNTTGRKTKDAVSEASRLVNKEDSDVSIPSYNLSGVRGPAMLDVSNYLRWTAENTVGKIKTNAARKKVLIDETLAALVTARELLEKTAKSNRERLPGDDYGVVSGLLQSGFNVGKAVTSVASTFGNAFKDSLLNKNADHTNPNNRPTTDANLGNQLLSGITGGLLGDSGTIKQKKWTAPGQTVLDYAGSDPSEDSSSSSLLGKLGNAALSAASKTLNSITGGLLGDDGTLPSETRNIGDLVQGTYGNGQLDSTVKFNKKESNELTIREMPDTSIGMSVTIADLFPVNSPLESLEDLNQAIKSSIYLTTPNKFTSTSEGPNYMTLDSNHVWEIIFRPYVGLYNGYSTWLPSFYEMDKINKKAFNMTTRFAYGWLPITGFELMSKKMASKDLALFDGSISFPVGLEFTNELRITFADDSLKTLKRYFDLCANVSAFMSNIHAVKPPSGYSGSSFDSTYGPPLTNQDKPNSFDDGLTPTVFLDGKVHPGNYKNLSFLVSIYILSPQLATIKKTNLLCVMKDYTIENQGEADASPTDLTVSFSVVGENPGDAPEMARATYPTATATGSGSLIGTIANVAGNLGSLAKTAVKLI